MAASEQLAALTQTIAARAASEALSRQAPDSAVRAATSVMQAQRSAEAQQRRETLRYTQSVIPSPGRTCNCFRSERCKLEGKRKASRSYRRGPRRHPPCFLVRSRTAQLHVIVLTVAIIICVGYTGHVPHVRDTFGRSYGRAYEQSTREPLVTAETRALASDAAYVHI